jgi:hypothetical protein
LTEEQKSYCQILRATSLFGGVQSITLVSEISENKFTAIQLGTTGLGIIAYTTLV